MNEYSQKVLMGKIKLCNNVIEGIVVDDNDPFMKSRVKVYIPDLTCPPCDSRIVRSDNRSSTEEEEQLNSDLGHLNKDALPWYSVAYPASSDSNAAKSVPCVNSRVLVEFKDNDIYNGIVVAVIASRPADAINS